METCKSSGFQTADSLVKAGPCLLVGVHLYMDGTNAASLIVYDGQSAAGKAVFKQATTAAGTNSAPVKYVFPLEIKDGIYCDITGTNAEYCIEYID